MFKKTRQLGRPKLARNAAARERGTSSRRAALLLLVVAIGGQLMGCSTLRRATTNGSDAASASAAQPDSRTPARAVSAAQDKRTRVARATSNNPGASAGYHFAMAQAYSAEGQTDRAIEEYRLAQLYDPDSALIATRLATEYLKKGMPSEAMAICTRAIARDPKLIDARLLLAGLYAANQDVELALKEYGQILKLDPEHEEALVYQAQLLIEEDRPAQAKRVVSTFVKRVPDSVLAWYYLGRAEQRLGQTQAAANAFWKAMEIRPGFAQAGLSLGLLYEEKQQWDRALQTYRRLFEESQDVTAATRLATLLLKKEQYAQALTYLEAIGRLDPEDLNARVKLGLVQMELKRYPAAIATFEAILKETPDSDRVNYYLASVYEETGQFDLARGAFMRVPENSKLRVDAVLHTAYITKQTQGTEAALAFIAEAITASPKNAGYYLFEATLHDERKDLRGAVSVLERAIGLFPDEERVLYYLGSLYDRTGRIDEGMIKMESILRVNPNHAEALNYLGYTWTTRGVRLDDAERVLKRALKLKPNNAFIQDSWGWYLFTRGRFEDAVIALERAVRLKGNEAPILEHLGDAYAKLNLREKALEQYRLAATHAEDDASRKQLLAKLETLLLEVQTARGATPTSERAPASASEASQR